MTESNSHPFLLQNEFQKLEKMFLNEQLLLEGLAVISTYPPNVKYVERFTECRKIARSKGVGIWNN